MTSGFLELLAVLPAQRRAGAFAFFPARIGPFSRDFFCLGGHPHSLWLTWKPSPSPESQGRVSPITPPLSVAAGHFSVLVTSFAPPRPARLGPPPVGPVWSGCSQRCRVTFSLASLLRAPYFPSQGPAGSQKTAGLFSKGLALTGDFCGRNGLWRPHGLRAGSSPSHTLQRNDRTEGRTLKIPTRAPLPRLAGRGAGGGSSKSTAPGTWVSSTHELSLCRHSQTIWRYPALHFLILKNPTSCNRMLF